MSLRWLLFGFVLVLLVGTVTASNWWDGLKGVIGIGGAGHTIMTSSVDGSNSTYGWGLNSNGQIGDNSIIDRGLPVETLLVGGVLISAGQVHTCAVDNQSQAWCWGSSESGKLGIGIGGFENIMVPTEVNDSSGMLNSSVIAAGYSHSCAIDLDGVAWCWGAGGYLGDGTYSTRLIPIKVNSTLLGEDVITIDAGTYSTVAITSDGLLYCWIGAGSLGVCGVGSTTQQLNPVHVHNDTGMYKVVDASTARIHSCAIDNESQAWCWGDNWWGNIGDGSTDQRLEPVKVTNSTGMNNVTMVTVIDRNSFALDTNGQMWCWGQAIYCGTGESDSYIYYLVPQRVSNSTGLYGVATIPTIASSGGQPYHMCAIDINGQAWCWGTGTYGAVGDNDTANHLVSLPYPVEGMFLGDSTLPNTTAGSIIPSLAYTSDELNCSATCTDTQPYGMYVNFTWYKNDANIDTYDTQVECEYNSAYDSICYTDIAVSEQLVASDEWICSAICYDGSGYSTDWENTTTATISPGCSTIDVGGYYQLSYDVGSAAFDVDHKCFIINSSDVYFDCDNYVITGDSSVSGFTAFDLGVNNSNITITNCNLANLTYGITGNNTHDSVFHNNSFYNFDPPITYGVYLQSVDNTHSNVNITGNTFFDNGHSFFGIFLDGNSQWSEVLIEDNVINESNNVWAIRCNQCINSSIAFNNITTPYAAIMVNASGSSLRINDNIIDVGITGSSLTIGFCEDLSVYRNNLTGSWGLYMYQTNHSNFSNNYLVGSDWGFVIDSSDNNTFGYNTVVNSRTYGVYIADWWDGPPLDNEFIGNNVTGSLDTDFICESTWTQVDSGNICDTVGGSCTWLTSCPSPAPTPTPTPTPIYGGTAGGATPTPVAAAAGSPTPPPVEIQIPSDPSAFILVVIAAFGLLLILTSTSKGRGRR